MSFNFQNCSAIILDPTQEAYQIKSSAAFTELHIINPFPIDASKKAYEARTAQWNPLSKLYIPEEQDLRISYLEKLAGFLFPNPTNGQQNFWEESSRSFFLGLALYVLESEEKPRTMGQILREAQSGGDSDNSILEYWANIIEKKQKSGKPLSLACVQALTDLLPTGQNMLTTLRKCITTYLDLWHNPIADAMTSGDSFDLRDLREKKMGIYLSISPGNFNAADVFLRLFIKQAMDAHMPEKADNDEPKYRLVIQLDEFVPCE